MFSILATTNPSSSPAVGRTTPFLNPFSGFIFAGAELDSNDWKLLENLVALLAEVHNLTLKWSCNSSTLSSVIPDMRVLLVCWIIWMYSGKKANMLVPFLRHIGTIQKTSWRVWNIWTVPQPFPTIISHNRLIEKKRVTNGRTYGPTDGQTLL